MINLYGVRHLSPGAAVDLNGYLDRVKPKAVLVEGLSDATALLVHFANKKTKPPIALLAYTEEFPVRTLTLPFAEYSPEYVAVQWALKHKAHLEFIDLPSDVFLKIEYMRPIEREGDGSEEVTGDAPVRSDKDGEEVLRRDVYSEIARASGYDDYDDYWERLYELNTTPDDYRQSAIEFGRQLRELRTDPPADEAKNLIREAHMRLKINAVLECFAPEQVVVVTGAYHTSALSGDLPAMTQEEFDSLPRTATRLTLMPYSYYRLSTRSGYGAGNNAPEYYGMLYHALRDGELDNLAATYFSQVAFYLRTHGTHRSTAEVIEAVRLARNLAFMRSGREVPSLYDLRDAAITCLGYGERTAVMEAFAATEIGTRIGELPEGVSKTSIQDDFYRQLQLLKLDKYRTNVLQDLSLDLRENRRVKSDDLAYLDLARSRFLHRLRVLGISFQKLGSSGQTSSTWAENWALQWTPEAEIEIVESALKGETLEMAVAYVYKSQLDEASSIDTIGNIIRDSAYCGMPDIMEMARIRLQELSVDTDGFNAIASTLHSLASTIKGGALRRYDIDKFYPLVTSLFLRACLVLPSACTCNNDAAKDAAHSIHIVNSVASDYYEYTDGEFWLNTVREIASRDDLNPGLSGYAASILMEQGLLPDAELTMMVSRRLSPGVPSDLGAGWFEGLVSRNKYVLLSRLSLWESVDGYLDSLDEEQYLRALVFLRRAFGRFSPQEKRTVCENLAEIWGITAEQAENMMSDELDETEKETIESLNDFDFDL